MTLNTTYSPTVADGNGVTTSFSYSFNPISANYLKVSLEVGGVWVEQVSGWTATTSENGGVVTFSTAPSSRVCIERVVPEEQPTAYKTSSGFQAQVIEHSFDMLTGMVQQLQEKSDRSVAVDVGSSVDPDTLVREVERVYSSIDNVDTVADNISNVNTIANNVTKVYLVANNISDVNAVGQNITKVNAVSADLTNIDTVATDIADVSAVAGDIAKVTAVADDLTKIDAVQADLTNIDTVATNISDVSAVGGDIAKVSAVADDLTNIDAVNANKTNIDTVATNIADVMYVGGSIASVNSVAADLTNIDSVNNNKTNIDTVATNIANVNLVGADIVNVSAVADDLTNIDAVNANKTNIDKVASIKNDVTTVAGIQGDVMAVAADASMLQAVHSDLSNIDAVALDKINIDAVANNIADVNTVASHSTNVDTVATNIGVVTTTANNITAINDAPTYAAQAKQWAIGVPGEPTGGSAKYWAERAEDAASGMENPANRDLSNLTNTGQAIIETADGTISNYIKEVPQNLKLELSGNVLTVKTGSILTGAGTVYATYTVASDQIKDLSTYNLSDGNYVLFVAHNGGIKQPRAMAKVTSGTTFPTTDLNSLNLHYNTTDKEFYAYDTVEQTWGITNICYPLCIINVASGIYNFAKDSNGNDLIFNGFGFVGHHIFVMPDVMGYACNGINADGSLASVSVRNNAMRIIEMTSSTNQNHEISIQTNRALVNWSGYEEVVYEADADYTQANIRYYIRDLNLIKMYRNGEISVVDGLPLVSYFYTGTEVTDFTPKQCVRTATVEMVDKVQAQVDTNTTAIASKQDTLVSGTNIKTINSTSVLGSGNFTLADQSLSNLSSAGQMIIDSQNGTISNCILEIPQNIKLTLENNVLTLKSGSVLTIPGSVYTTVTTTQDLTETFNLNGTYLVCPKSNGTQILYRAFDNCVSGAGATTVGGYAFDTTAMTNGYYLSDGTLAQLCSYPICIIKVENGVASFAKDSNGNDMIFNGVCFVGSSIIVYPNVKGLIPNYKDSKGKLNNILCTMNSVAVYTMTANKSNLPLYVMYNSTIDYFTYGTYLEDRNINIRANNNLVINGYEFGRFTTDEYAKITDFTIRQPVRTATVEMVDKKQDVLTTITGYDATKTQTLKNVSGVLTWVDDII